MKKYRWDWIFIVAEFFLAGFALVSWCIGYNVHNYISPRYSHAWMNWLIFFFGLTAALAGCWTVFKIVDTPRSDRQPEWAKRALILWTILPPLWFWGEYWLFWRNGPIPKFHPELTANEALERFEHAQELGRNVWIAFVALLAAFYFEGSHGQGQKED
jgi:hypothetical protein